MITILDKEQVRRTVPRLAMQAVEKNEGLEDLVLIGIRTRGVILAQRMQEAIRKIEGAEVPCGVLDIALYRDDLLSGTCDAVFKGSEIDFDLDGKNVVLCDDVMYTGRTVRAALSAISSLGRPKSVRLYCLVDRGHRELPFRAEGVGKSVPTSREEQIVVHLEETDGDEGVYLLKKGETFSKEQAK